MLTENRQETRRKPGRPRARLRGALARAADSRWSELWLALCAFFNSFIVPLPAETLLVPLCLARPERSWRFAAIATVFSVLGGIAGYLIGALAFSTLGAEIVDFYGSAEEFNDLTSRFNAAGLEWILLATISPLPYKLVTISSGVAGMSFGLFVGASVIGRVLGYFALAGLCWRFGGSAVAAMQSRPTRAAALVALFVGAYCLLS